MSLSSLLVVGNALRLRQVAPEEGSTAAGPSEGRIE
jgi:hypothetical protein